MKAAELIKKYAVNIFAAAVCVFALSLPASAEKAVDTLAVEYLLPNGSTYTVKAFATDRNKIDEEDAEEIVEIPADNEYSIVLPYAVGGSSVIVKLADGASVEIDGQKLYNGSAFIPQKGVHTIVCEGEEYNLNVFYTSDLPVLYIETDQSIDYVNEDKHNRASGSIVVVNGSATEYDGVLEYIKGRGNATWKSPKKPYSIKLGKKASLFGMEKSKKYNLLAEYSDKSMLRNKLALELAHSVGIEYCVDSQFVEVYYNNEYLGSYLLTEKVEVAEGRVDILDLEYVNEQSNPDTNLDTVTTMSNYPDDEFSTPGAYKWCDIPNDLTSGLTGGYLLEIDTMRRYNDEVSGFVTNYGEFVAIKGPEHATKGQVEYIRDYYQQFEDALLSDDGYNQLGKHYTDYADMESMAKMYVLQEYVQNLDAGMTSFYICKNEKGKLTMCSAWDFDNSLGANYIYHGFDLSNPDKVWVAQGGMQSEEEKKIIFTLLWRHEDFRREAARQWSEVFRPCIKNLQETFEQSRVELYDTAVIRNYRRRKREYITIDESAKYFYEDTDTVAEYISARAEFMDRFLSEDKRDVYYFANGGSGVVTDWFTYSEGEITTAKENLFTHNGGYNFAGWNTQPDGSGTAYQPGDTVQIEDSDVELYAQWENLPYVEQAAVAQQNKAGFFASVIMWFKKLFG